MRAQTFTKFGIGLVAITLATCTLAAPASADPSAGTFGTLVGTGSDTTQDVVNGLSAAIGGSKGLRIASYDAVGSATITPRDGGVSMPRGGNSDGGRDALRVSIGQITEATGTVAGAAAQWTGANTIGNVDFARSSSVVSGTDAVNDGVLTYVPFAKDAVTFATSSSSLFPALTLGSASDAAGTDGVGPSTLFAIYGGKVTRIITAPGAATKLVNDSYVKTEAETSTPIHAYVPAAGSGTRKFWIGKVGVTEAQITAGTVPVLAAFNKTTANPNGTPVQEHDGSALVGDAGAIVPFSIGQWVSQGNSLPGVTDRRNGAVLGAIGTQTPTVGTAGNYELNPGFDVITRLVYNIVPSAEIDDKDSLTNWAFEGTGSLICSQKDVIKKYGFGVLTGTGKNACGDISTRGFAPAASTVTLNAKSSVKYGSSLALSATVASNNNGGGALEFYNGSTKLATVQIPKGKTTAATTYKTTSATSIADLKLSTVFIPNLSGVAEYETPAGSEVAVDVQTATSSVKATVASVKANVAPVAKVKVTATGVFATGSVTIKEGTKTLKAGAKLNSAGAVNVTLPKLNKGTHKLVVTYTGSKLVAAGKSATITVKIK